MTNLRTATKLRLRLARLGVALGAAALCWACNAPFIPIPPPGQATSFSSALVSDGAGGQKTVWIAHGAPLEVAKMARFNIFDDNVGAGVIAQAAVDGSYTSPPMDGAAGDRVEISFETPGGALSATACFLLKEGDDPPKCPN